jgi:hypothetical protein
MFGSTVLEVTTGLVFIFLLVALICSQVGNKVSEILNWRAKDLQAGLRDILLGKNQVLLHKLYESSYVQQANQVVTPLMARLLSSPFGNLIFAHIKQGADSVLGPIHLDARSFALAFFDAIMPNEAGETGVDRWRQAIANMPEMPLKKALLPIAQSADKKIDDAYARIEEWFRHAEEQMTAIYRQHMWAFAILIGLIISIGLNIDTIAIGDRLWRDPVLRAAVTEAATKYELQPGGEAQARAELEKLNLPIGWELKRGDWVIGGVPIPRPVPNDWIQKTISPAPWAQVRDTLVKILGWIITALAGAQGAPFWFDVLKRIRSVPATQPAPSK